MKWCHLNLSTIHIFRKVFYTKYLVIILLTLNFSEKEKEMSTFDFDSALSLFKEQPQKERQSQCWPCFYFFGKNENPIMSPRMTHLYHLTLSASNKRLILKQRWKPHAKNQEFKTVHLSCNSLQGWRQLGIPQTSFREPAIKEEMSSTSQTYFGL